MTQNILVQFDSDTSGVDVAKQKMSELSAKEKELSDTSTKGFKETTSAIKEFTDGVTNAGKASVGAFATKSIKEYQAAISQTLKDTVAGFNLSDQQARKFFKNLQDEAKKGLLGKGSSDEMKQFQASLNAATEALKELGDAGEKTASKTTSFRAQLRAMKDELNALDEAGQSDTTRFYELSVAAGKLEDQIGDTNTRLKLMSSDTFVFDALISGMQGVAGAFAVGQGAIGLFGDDSKELQETLLKVNSAMSILQGLQQVQNLIRDQSIAKTGVEVALQKIKILQTNLDTAAQSGNIVVRYAAIAAQSALNVVMAANPAGLLLAGIAAVAGALLYFTSNTNKETEALSKLNTEMKNELDTLESLNKEYLKPYDDRIKQTTNELTALKARNVSQDVILQKELQLTRLNADRSNAQKGHLASEVQDIGLVSAQIDDQISKVKALQTQLDNKGTEGFFSKWFTVGGKSKSELEDALKTSQDSLSNLQKQYQLGVTARDDADKNSADLQAKNAEIAKYNREQSIKNAVAGAEAVVASQIEGTHKALTAELNAIEVRKNTDLLNVNLTQGERAKIIATARQAEAKAQFDYDQKQSDIALKSLDARAGLQFEGTQKRLSIELYALDIAKAKELQEFTVVNGEEIRIKNLSVKQKQEIDDRYNKIRIDKTNATNQKMAEDEINSRISNINSQISSLEINGAKADNEQLLQLKKDLISEQGFLEVTSLTFTEHNEVLRREKIAAVNAKVLADKKQLERDKAAAEIDASLSYQNTYESLQAGRAQRVLNSQKSTFAQRIKAENDYYLHTSNSLTNELGAEEDRYNKGIVTYEAYQTKKLEIQDKIEAASFQHTEAIEQLKSARLVAIAEFTNQGLGTLLNAASTSQSAKYQAELAEVQDLEDRKMITKEEAEKRNKKIRRDQAAEEKKLSLFEAGLNMSLAISKAIASAPFPKNLLSIAFATFQGLAQIAAIASRPLPQLWKGTKKAKEGVYRTGELGQELMWHKDTGYQMLGKRGEEVNFIPEGARVYNNAETTSIMRDFPSMTSLPKNALQQVSAKIDVDGLAEKIGGRIENAFKQMPSYEWNVDNDGLKQSVLRGNQYTEYVNKKFSSRK